MILKVAADIRAQAEQLRQRAAALEQVANLQEMIEHLASQVPVRSEQRAALQPYEHVVDILLLDEVQTMTIKYVATACQQVLQSMSAGRTEEGGEIKMWGWPSGA